MKILLVLWMILCVNGAMSDDDLQSQWKEWKLKYQKKYSDKEDRTRFETWLKTLKKVEEHNKLYEDGQTTFMMETNEFAAMTNEEFRKMLMPESVSFVMPDHKVGIYFDQVASVSNYVNWTQENYVTPVQHQGGILSCYAFSAVGAIEGQHRKQTGELVSFSKQQIVDCDGQGGDGGYPYKSLEYLANCGGLETEAKYPYTGEVGSCQFGENRAVAFVESAEWVTPGQNETVLKSAVANIGPISVGYIKIFQSFKCYKTGIYYESQCNSANEDGLLERHAMLVTGYGTDSNGIDYWLVKNSWGVDWGENGYIRMERNRDNNCGIANQPSYPIMASNKTVIKGACGTGYRLLPSVVVLFFTVSVGFVLQIV